jgi:predicted transcriptional regulator
MLPHPKILPMTPSMVEVLNALEERRGSVMTVDDIVATTLYRRGAVNSAIWRLLALGVIQRSNARREPGKPGGARYAYGLPAMAPTGSGEAA